MDKKGESFVRVEADLLCDEEATSFSFDDGEVLYEEARNGRTGTSCCNGDEKSERMIDLPLLSDEWYKWMIEREKHYLPRNDYLERLRSGELDISSRKEVIDWMVKACVHHNFGEISLYCSVNYFDRFISEYDLPAGKTWPNQLVAVACLLLAAKMHEVDIPNTIDLQCGFMEQPGEPTFFLFESKTVKRMEMLLLNILKWNINPCTPLSFIEYFLQKINRNELRILIARSSQIVVRNIKGIDFLEFRPSEIAAAITSYISGEMQGPHQVTQPCSAETEKGRVVKCLKLIQDSMSTSCITDGFSSVALSSATSTNSPNSVLKASFWGDEGVVLRSYRSSSENTNPDAKRRKLDHHRNRTSSGGDL